MKGFLADLYLRPSCYNCPAKAGKSCSDLTLGDFWGINKYNFDDDKGTGAIILYTIKSENIIKSIQIEKESTNYCEVANLNPAIYLSVILTKKRSNFWQYYNKVHDIESSILYALKPNLKEKIRSKLKKILRK